MAHHKSAQKRVRRDKAKKLINHGHISRIRSFCKKFYTVLDKGTPEEIASAVREAQSTIARGVTKGVLHRNTAARKISRLMSCLPSAGKKS